MPLYKLFITETISSRPSHLSAIVVIANDEATARKLATDCSQKQGDPDPTVWSDSDRTTIVALRDSYGYHTKPQIVCFGNA